MNWRISASRSCWVLANSSKPEVKRSIRCTTSARCPCDFISSERRDCTEGALDPSTGTESSPAGLLTIMMASSSNKTASSRERCVTREPGLAEGLPCLPGNFFIGKERWSADDAQSWYQHSHARAGRVAVFERFVSGHAYRRANRATHDAACIFIPIGIAEAMP